MLVLLALAFAVEFLAKPFVISIIQKKVQSDLKASGITVRGLQFKFRPWSFTQGDLFIKEVRYDKLTLADVRSPVRLEGQNVFLDGLTGEVLNGRMDADVKVSMGDGTVYSAKFNFSALDLVALVEDFELKDRVQMSGLLGGVLQVNGTGGRVDVLSGDLASGGSGGLIIITDTRFLENMARASKQPVDIVVESFRNYHYTKGNVTLSLDKGNLVLDAALDGETGKRNLNVTLHDVIPKGEGL